VLYVGICCQEIANDVLLQGSLVMEVTGWEIRPAGRVVSNHVAVAV